MKKRQRDRGWNREDGGQGREGDPKGEMEKLLRIYFFQKAMAMDRVTMG
jgi:hypothetical protein